MIAQIQQHKDDRRLPKSVFVGVFSFLIAGLLISNLAQIARLFTAPIAGQDEGVALVYTDQVLRGSLNYVDFDSVYPYPLNLIVAPLFVLISDDLLTLRIVLYLMLIAFTAYAIVHSVQNRLFVLIQVLALTSYWPGVAVYWYFALVLLGLGFVLLVSPRRWLALTSGLLLGLSTSIRYDFALVAIPIAIGLWYSCRKVDDCKCFTPHPKHVLMGLILGIFPGSLNMFQVAIGDGLRNWNYKQAQIRRGRFLEIVSDNQQRWLLALVLIFGCYTAYLVALRRRGTASNGVWIVIFGSLAGALALSLTTTIQRLDVYHMHNFLTLFLTTTIGHTVLLSKTIQLGNRAKKSRFVFCLLTILVVLPPANDQRFGFIKVRSPLELPQTLQMVSSKLCGPRRCIPVSEQALIYQPVVSYLSDHPDRTVFIGGNDLNTAYYSDNWIYAVLSNPTCSRYLELNPGGPNRKDFDLVADLSDCDYLVLNSVYDGVFENRFSRDVSEGSDRNRLKQDFQIVFESYGVFIYKRSDVN